MIPMTLPEIAAVVGGVVHDDPGVSVTGPAFIDTRAPQEGGLFAAFVGPRRSVGSIGRQEAREVPEAVAPVAGGVTPAGQYPGVELPVRRRPVSISRSRLIRHSRSLAMRYAGLSASRTRPARH